MQNYLWSSTFWQLEHELRIVSTQQYDSQRACNGALCSCLKYSKVTRRIRHWIRSPRVGDIELSEDDSEESFSGSFEVEASGDISLGLFELESLSGLELYDSSLSAKLAQLLLFRSLYIINQWFT